MRKQFDSGEISQIDGGVWARVSIALVACLLALLFGPMANAGTGTWCDPYQMWEENSDCGASQYECDPINAMVVQENFGHLSYPAQGLDRWFFFAQNTYIQRFRRTCQPFNGVTCTHENQFAASDPPGYREQWQTPELPCTSPILIDLGKNGIDLGPRGTGVAFDIDADGTPDRIQWVRSGGDEAFLALDLNANGTIDDGSELFGNNTPIVGAGGRTAGNGFEALAQYDERTVGGNSDGKITPADTVWARLRLWIDSNVDGHSGPEEIFTLRQQGVVALSTIPGWRREQRDEAGNRLPLWAVAESETAPTRMAMVDVFFARLPVTSISSRRSVEGP